MASNAGKSTESNKRAWFAVAAATIAAFISLLDVTVTNASLPQIQGSIGASGTEGTWIGTAYLAAEVVMIPLTAWFSRMLGVRLYLVGAIAIFTLFSLICGFSNTLAEIIVGRVGQGFAGGALLPVGLTIIQTRLTSKQQVAGLSVYATMTTLAPILGPPLGGWLTENVSWHWIFFTNIPLGGMLAIMTMAALDPAPIHKEEFTKGDWIGIVGLATALASLTVLLEEGQRENWFESNEIVALTLGMLGGFMLVFLSQLRTERPVLKLRLLRTRSYAAMIICSAVMGGASFAVMYLIPTFLAAIAGYDAQQTGLVSVYSGITSFLFMPVFAYMMSRTDIRLMIAGGLSLYAMSNLMDTSLTISTVGAAFVISQLIRGGALIMALLPMSQVSTADLPPEDVADGAALFTVARNIGGSAALALTGVLIDRRLHFHTEQIGEANTGNSLVAQERVSEISKVLLQRGADVSHAQLQAFRMIAKEVQRQALVMSYIDAFWILGISMLIALPAVPFIRKNIGQGGLAAAH